jgi:Xaa-Pro dipeptidase
MNQDRRHFIKTGSLSLALTGIVPAFLNACKQIKPDQSELSDLTSGVVPLNNTDYLRRQERARRLLAENNMDALWIEGGTNMQYFFDVSWWMSERVFGVVLPVLGDPVWICPGFEGPRAEELIRFGKDIRLWKEHESPYALLGDIFRSIAPAGRIAIDPGVRNFVVEGMRRECNAELRDGSVVINYCRGIKDEKELAYMELANTITKKAYRWAFGQVQAGMAPGELRSLISSGHRQQGVSGSASPLFGHLSAFPHGSREQNELRDGDIILVDGGCSIEGYRSDVTRTIIFGTPSDKQLRVFDIVKKAQAAAMDAVRPGLPAGELDRIAREVVEDSGYGPEYTYFAHRLGHGIGMEGHEWPYLVKDNPLPLEPGMTFSNEPGIYIYDEFGIRIEDCFYVTEDGGKYLGGMLCNSLMDPFGD